MELIVYPLLCRESKLCLKRRKWRYGSVYHYNPRPQLIKRLASLLNWEETKVKEQIQAERSFISQNPQYYQL